MSAARLSEHPLAAISGKGGWLQGQLGETRAAQVLFGKPNLVLQTLG
jgi:hypothetical protein